MVLEFKQDPENVQDVTQNYVPYEKNQENQFTRGRTIRRFQPLHDSGLDSSDRDKAAPKTMI